MAGPGVNLVDLVCLGPGAGSVGVPTVPVKVDYVPPLFPFPAVIGWEKNKEPEWSFYLLLGLTLFTEVIGPITCDRFSHCLC